MVITISPHIVIIQLYQNVLDLKTLDLEHLKYFCNSIIETNFVIFSLLCY